MLQKYPKEHKLCSFKIKCGMCVSFIYLIIVLVIYLCVYDISTTSSDAFVIRIICGNRSASNVHRSTENFLSHWLRDEQVSYSMAYRIEH